MFFSIYYVLLLLLCITTIYHVVLSILYLLIYICLDFLFQSNPLWFISMAYKDGIISMELVRG